MKGAYTKALHLHFPWPWLGITLQPIRMIYCITNCLGDIVGGDKRILGVEGHSRQRKWNK